MNNAATGVDIPLSTFGGLSTELSPTDLPEGGCPDNQDCAYLPGSVLTRPGLSRFYANPPTTAKIVYHATFTAKDGTDYNVFLDANGNIFVEDTTNSPQTFTTMGSVPAGSKCKSVAAFGRLYMAFNDGFRGTDIPRSFDGSNFDRISQGGPSGNPSFAETILPSVALGALPGGGVTANISTLSASGPYTVNDGYYDPDLRRWVNQYVTYYEYLTIVVDNGTGFASGQLVTVAGCSQGNGTYTVNTVNGTTITVLYNDTPHLSGAGGTLTTGSAVTMSRSSDTVTAGTAAAHGLKPGDMFSVSGVANTSIGSISATARASNVITITTSAATGVRVGSVVIISGVTDTTFNGTWTVTAVIDSTHFQFTSSNLADATSSGGTVYGQWNNTQRFVISTPTTTSLTYNDPGPDASTSGSGTITPVGQVAGGERNAVLIFKTATGFLTEPSIPVRVTTSGGKKLVVNGVPLGPSNVVERIVAFTGVDGSRYFYIPVPARSNGNVISSSTVIPDNTSTSAIFDFSDATLLSASAIDIDGNDLFELKILGNCSGVTFYGDRMWYWGDENIAISFQNMGFEGGLDATNLPLGWTVAGSGLSVVTNGDFGDAIEYAAGSTAIISQGAYLDYYGDQILEPSTQYTFKCWAKQSGSGASVVAEIYDTNTSTVLASATIAIPAAVGFISGKFSSLTPSSITSTTVLRVRVTGNGSSAVTLDELKIIYSANPYNDGTFSVSYVINPESVDAVTGIIGATSDANPIMDTAILPDKGYTDASRMPENFYFVTRGINGSLQTTKAVAGQEPSGWLVAQLGRNCGACSMFAMISGESWVGWACDDGYRLFDTSDPVKITQDFQSKWDAINPNARTSIWAMNDVTNRRMYWGVPINGATDANFVYMLDYRYAENASQIEDRGAIRISQFTGKMLVIEMSRKFSPWTIQATWGGFLAKNGQTVCAFSDASGRTYTLDPTKLHDDDYGTIPWYFVTSPFVPGEVEQALQLGNHRHLYTFLAAAVTGTGEITVTPLADALTNAWPARGPYSFPANAKLLEIPLNVAAERCFFKFSGAAISPSLDSAFNLSRMTVTMEPHPFSPVRGAA